MKPGHTSETTENEGPGDRWILLGMGVLSLLPLAIYHGMFERLFWFGDELDLIDQIDRLGFFKWVWLVFAENFVPVFKCLWGGAILAFGGSYFAMIVLTWLTHALNVVLLGRLMRTCGQSWVAVLFAQLVFGLTSINLETLAWSVQWSAVLSVFFMLLALDQLARGTLGLSPIWSSAASALSFSRGVLTGLLLAFAAAGPGGWGPGARFPRRAAYAAAYLLPSIVVGLLITILVPSGNHRHMEGHWGDAAIFGTWYYCLNPAHRLFGVESWGPRTVAILGVLKVALVAWAVSRSRGRQRMLFIVLVLFDLGNAVLLGIGRYHTGLSAAVSSRYQYASLIGILPLAGFWVSRMWERIPTSSAPRRLILAALLGAAAISMCRQWPAQLDPFTTWRGTDSRTILSDNPGPGTHEVPGIPWMPIERARDLMLKYNLH